MKSIGSAREPFRAYRLRLTTRPFDRHDCFIETTVSFTVHLSKYILDSVPFKPNPPEYFDLI